MRLITFPIDTINRVRDKASHMTDRQTVVNKQVVRDKAEDKEVAREAVTVCVCHYHTTLTQPENTTI